VNNAQNATLDDHEDRLDNLSNVTNDAQLKRAAGDLNSFTNKATIANGDVFVIEDSENGYAKKKVTASQIVAAGGGGGDVYGPASSVSDDIALLDGVTGKLLKDSGVKLDTGTTAGTVPVRDGSGKVPGSITGDSATVGGVAQSGFVRKSAGSPQVMTDVLRVKNTEIDEDSIEINAYGSGNRHAFIDFHNADSPSDYTGRISMLSGSANMLYRTNVSEGYHDFNQWIHAQRGLKNTLYNVNWTIALSPNQAFTIHQPVMAMIDSTAIQFYYNNIIHTIITSTSNQGASLSPGRYINNSATVTNYIYIGYSPSQTQSDIITLH